MYGRTNSRHYGTCCRKYDGTIIRTFLGAAFGPSLFVQNNLGKENGMAKYGPKAQEKVEKTVKEMKEGKLKSSSGQKVTSRKQAVAIGLSEARKQGAKVPKKKS